MNRFVFLLLTALLLSSMGSLHVYANQEIVTNQVIKECVCETQPWQEVFDTSKHVAFGEVKAIQVHGETLASGAFIPMETFKGEGSHIHKIVGSAQKGDVCHSKLVPGFYIAFSSDSHTVVLNACSPSKKLSDQEIVSTLTTLKNYADLKAGSADTNMAKASQKDASQQNGGKDAQNGGFSIWMLAFAIIALGLLALLAKKVLQRPKK